MNIHCAWVRTAAVLAVGFAVQIIPAGAAGQTEDAEISRSESRSHPVIACSSEELYRLRDAYQGVGPAHDLLAEQVKAAERALSEPLEFPPRGGQHNQWCQCDTCQMGLETVDDTHHKCPRCGTVYTGEPYDDVIFSRKHGRNMSNARVAAWAYALSGEKRYARYTAKVLLGYAERYRDYPYHTARRTATGNGGGHILEQSLSEASTLAIHIAPAFDLIHGWEILSKADRDKIRDGLIVPMLENINRHKCGIGNWQTWHNAAMLTGGAAIGDATWVRRALTQQGNGFFYQMDNSVSEDGMWYENSWGYHFYALRAMVLIVDGARCLGMDLCAHPKLKPMFLLPISYAMADGSLPRFGDDVQTTLSGHAGMFEAAYHAYGDPFIRAVLPDGVSWESIRYGRYAEEAEKGSRRKNGLELRSVLFQRTGHAILRTEGPAGLTAALTFSPFGGFHAHYDKLSFVFFGHGTELGVDPGRARSQAYRLPIHGEWYRATLSHNTVMVDGLSQGPAGGTPFSFAASGEYTGVVAGCTEAYPALAHRRFLLLTPTYLLVFDELESASGDRTFDWIYHNRGSAVRCSAATEPVDLSETDGGLQYIDNAFRGSFSGPVRTKFDYDEVTTHFLLAGEPETDILIGDGPGGSILDRIPLILATRRGRSGRFVAVLEPVRSGSEPAIRGVICNRHGGDQFVHIDRGEEKDVILLQADNGFVVRVNDQQVLGGEPLSEEPNR